MARETWKALRAPKSAMGMVLALVLGAPVMCSADTVGLVISEFMPYPIDSDPDREYVELRATRDIDFATHPHSVVFSNNGIATTLGWLEGKHVTYGFNITTGSVSAGEVIYVGGSGMDPTGRKLRTKDIVSEGGDRVGYASYNGNVGVLGNGGGNADGIAVFGMNLNDVTSSTSPIDAIFYGTGRGTAIPSSGGYQLPVNDFYPVGGKFKSNSFIISAVDTLLNGRTIVLDGVYNTITGEWERKRSYRIEDGTDGISAIQLILPAPPVNPPPPTAVPLPGAAWGGIVLMGVVGVWRARPWRKR